MKTRSERREQKNRRHMPVHGRSFSSAYANAILARAERAQKKASNTKEK